MRIVALAVALGIVALGFVMSLGGHQPRDLTATTPDTTPTSGATYSRDGFGSGWADLDRDGCETRDEILARDLADVVTDDGCDVKSGTLHDPYTGRTIDFTDSAYWTVDVDHIYPLHLAWLNGADQWTRAQRVAFANDPTNLLAVQASANRSKGDSGPSEWVPANRAYACTYAWKYTRIAAAYNLPVSKDDLHSLDLLHTTCPEG